MCAAERMSLGVPPRLGAFETKQVFVSNGDFPEAWPRDRTFQTAPCGMTL
jgi:hypothetical protein